MEETGSEDEQIVERKVSNNNATANSEQNSHHANVVNSNGRNKKNR